MDLIIAMQGGGEFDPADAAALGAVLVGLLVIAAIGLIISIVICALLYSAQKRVPVEHQKLSPGLVWLMLIPLFNYVWGFFVFLKIPESYQSYFASQGRTDVGDCGRSLGLWTAILYAGGLISGCIPFVGLLIPLAFLVLLIIFLVKISGLKNQIPATAATA